MHDGVQPKLIQQHGWYLALILCLLAGGGYFSSALLTRNAASTRDFDINKTLPQGSHVTVSRIINGDELLIQHDEAYSRVRMLGIHSFDPVINEREITAFGDASLRFLERWILQKRVTLHFDTPIKDTRNRHLAYVHLDDIDINRRMLEEGLAMVYTEFPTRREAEYLTSEEQARRAGRGIWSGTKAQRRAYAWRKQWLAIRDARGSLSIPDPLLLSPISQ